MIEDSAISGIAESPDARRVRRDFWRKIRRTAGRVPFAEEAVAAYYCALDPVTPSRTRAILLGALAYFVMPADAIPDFVAGLGYTDDAAVLFMAWKAVSGDIRESHRAQARQALERPDPPGGSAATP